MKARHQLRGAHASRVLVSAFRRNNLLSDVAREKRVEIKTKVRGREDALASTRNARAARNLRCNVH
jgi:hypothetical protein